MSIEALVWALNDAPCSSPTQKLVLIALANHARPDGTSAFPAVATIARYTLLSERSIRTHLDTLQAEGLIVPCDPSIVAAYISRTDRRPQGWNLNMGGVQRVQVVTERGANGAPNGVQEFPQRGAGDSERGAGVAPEPYITVQEPYKGETSQPSSEAKRLCSLLADLMVRNGSRRPTITKGWIAEMDRMMRLDGRTVAETEGAIRWSQSHSFWKANIMSPMKLRAKFDTMRLQAENERRNRAPRGYSGIADFLMEDE